MNEPTKRQQQVVDAIRGYQAQHGYPPTVRELAALIGVSSPNGVMCHLVPLRRKGLVTWENSYGRTLRVVDPPEPRGMPLVELGMITEV